MLDTVIFAFCWAAIAAGAALAILLGIYMIGGVVEETRWWRRGEE